MIGHQPLELLAGGLLSHAQRRSQVFLGLLTMSRLDEAFAIALPAFVLCLFAPGI